LNPCDLFLPALTKNFQKEFFCLADFEKIGLMDGGNGNRNKLQERYLKYRHYYVGLDLSGFGEYGKAVYAPLLPMFDQWFERKSLDDIPLITPLLGDKVYLHDHPDFRKETGEVIDFHIKVLALSMNGVILDENRDAVSRQLLGGVVYDVSRCTRSYDFSDRLCFFITVRLFIEMLKERYSHFGSPVTDLSLRDFANEDTLNPKPQEVISIPW
jgi:hypothetical protein